MSKITFNEFETIVHTTSSTQLCIELPEEAHYALVEEVHRIVSHVCKAADIDEDTISEITHELVGERLCAQYIRDDVTEMLLELENL